MEELLPGDDVYVNNIIIGYKSRDGKLSTDTITSYRGDKLQALIDSYAERGLTIIMFGASNKMYIQPPDNAKDS